MVLILKRAGRHPLSPCSSAPACMAFSSPLRFYSKRGNNQPKLAVWHSCDFLLNFPRVLPKCTGACPRGLLLSKGSGPVQTRPQPAQCQRVTQAHWIPPISHCLCRPSLHISLPHEHTHKHTHRQFPLCKKINGMFPNHRCCSTCLLHSSFTT